MDIQEEIRKLHALMVQSVEARKDRQSDWGALRDSLRELAQTWAESGDEFLHIHSRQLETFSDHCHSVHKADDNYFYYRFADEVSTNLKNFWFNLWVEDGGLEDR